MRKETLEGRLNAKKQETIALLKSEARFIKYCDDEKYVYELVKSIYGKMNKLILGFKNGKISIISMTELPNQK